MVGVTAAFGLDVMLSWLVDIRGFGRTSRAAANRRLIDLTGAGSGAKKETYHSIPGMQCCCSRAKGGRRCLQDGCGGAVVLGDRFSRV